MKVKKGRPRTDRTEVIHGRFTKENKKFLESTAEKKKIAITELLDKIVTNVRNPAESI